MDRRRAVLAIGAALAAGGARNACAASDPPSAADPAPLRAFVAASLLTAFSAAAEDWRRRREQAGAPAPELRLSYGSSAALARRIELGAPADLFVSAHPVWMARLAETGAVSAETVRPLAANRLALAAAPGRASGLASRTEIDGRIDLRGALGPRGRLVIGRANSVPLGVYGRMALMRLGLWESVADRLVEAKDARAALAFVARGAAPLGVLYASDLVSAENLAGENLAAESPGGGYPSAPGLRLVGLFPEDSHDPILYPAGLTRGGAERAAARDLLEALHGDLRAPAGRSVFRAHGFRPPGFRAPPAR